MDDNYIPEKDSFNGIFVESEISDYVDLESPENKKE